MALRVEEGSGFDQVSYPMEAGILLEPLQEEKGPYVEERITEERSRRSINSMVEEATPSHSESTQQNEIIVILGEPTPALNKGEVPWSAQRGNLSDKDRISKTVTGILNKLTPVKFDRLKGQLINSGIISADNLKGLISLIFDKATLEPTFCPMYARLCADLNDKLPTFPSEEPEGKPVTFKKVLLNICQEAFVGAEKLREEVRQMTAPYQHMERRDKEMILKIRSLGNIRFIGELFKQKMFPEKIVHHIVQELLGPDTESCPTEENVEAICLLFNAIGKELDHNQKACPVNEVYFNRLMELSTNTQLVPRLRFMIRDVLDLWTNNWVPRREEVETIFSLHKAEVSWSAWRGNLSDKDRILRIVKGILNGQSPEKFYLLKRQLIYNGIMSADILMGVISLIFDKAVLEPALCPMYAELCSDLNMNLPSFPSEEPEGRPITFKRVLLNICQEAFEGAEKLREEVRQMTGPEQEMESKEIERILKLRTLGNIRLIGELFNLKMLPEKIVHYIVQELLGPDAKSCPAEENVEAICQFFHTIGKQLYENQKARCTNEVYFNRLMELSTNTQLAPCLRFMIHDVLDLLTNNWVPGHKEGETIFSLHKAEVPWSASRGNLSDKDCILKIVKGVLNEQTPEKFYLLKSQLIDNGIMSADILKGVISLIFDKAVLEPALCPMYAELCSDLNMNLPSFPSEEPEGRPITFKRVLLNNCQEAFEGAEKLREEVRQMTGPEQEMESKEIERILKLRNIGNIRLIGELIRRRVFPERLGRHIVKELLGPDSNRRPDEENVEAICLFLNTVGQKFDYCQTAREANEVYFDRLKELSEDTQVAPHLRSMILDVLDSRRTNNCVTKLR